eukprot:07754_4
MSGNNRYLFLNSNPHQSWFSKTLWVLKQGSSLETDLKLMHPLKSGKMMLYFQNLLCSMRCLRYQRLLNLIEHPRFHFGKSSLAGSRSKLHSFESLISACCIQLLLFLFFPNAYWLFRLKVESMDLILGSSCVYFHEANYQFPNLMYLGGFHFLIEKLPYLHIHIRLAGLSLEACLSFSPRNCVLSQNISCRTVLSRGTFAFLSLL